MPLGVVVRASAWSCARRSRATTTLWTRCPCCIHRLDPNERFRARRDTVRRRKRRRRAAVAAILLLVVLAARGRHDARRQGRAERRTARAARQAARARRRSQVAIRPRPLPVEVRGVHVTGALASLPGKLEEYVGLTKHGLNTIELDIKDEGGEIAFTPAGVPLARKTGAVARLLQARAGRAARAPERRLPDRPRRRLPGPVPRRAPARPRRPSHATARSGRRTPGSPG